VLLAEDLVHSVLGRRGFDYDLGAARKTVGELLHVLCSVLNPFFSFDNTVRDHQDGLRVHLMEVKRCVHASRVVSMPLIAAGILPAHIRLR